MRASAPVASPGSGDRTERPASHAGTVWGNGPLPAERQRARRCHKRARLRRRAAVHHRWRARCVRRKPGPGGRCDRVGAVDV